MTTSAGLLSPFHEDPDRSGLFVDFDGTLADIVVDPAAARPRPGAATALERSARRLRGVWVVSGRPVSFLDPLMPRSVHLSGLYGLESSVDGRREIHPEAAAWQGAIDAAADAAETAAHDDPALAGLHVERKGGAVTLHFRGRTGLAEATRAFASARAHASGLVAHEARQSVELRPPIEIDKGDVIEAEAGEAGLAAVCFIGDDLGDLPAFDALDRLASRGVHTVRVAVRSDEAPPGLLDRADLVVDGPPAAVALIESLAD